MTKIGKVLCVFVLIISLAFLGVASVTVMGGVNWRVERDTVTGDYVFDKAVGETTTHSVKARRGDRALASGTKSLAAVVIKAHDDMVVQRNKQIQDLQAKTKLTNDEKDFWEQPLEIDKESMTARSDKLAVELATIREQIDGISKKNIELVQGTQKTLTTNESRREEIYRLLSQLEEIQTDLFQIKEQQKRLRSLLVRTSGVVGRLKRRQQQLVKAGARGQYEDDKAAPASPKPSPQKKSK